MKNKLVCLIASAVLALATFANAQSPALKQAFSVFKSTATLKNAAIGFSVIDAGSGAVLFSYNDSISLAPASCMKIPTTSAALGILGQTHRFYTKIGYAGSIDAKGVLHGNLVIIGGGDPTLGSARFAKRPQNDVMAYILKTINTAGIKKIEGKLIVDGSYFDDEAICPTWAWNDIGNYFGAGVYGLNYDENLYKIKLQAGIDEGDDVQMLSDSSRNPGFRFDNRLSTGPPHSGDQSNIFGSPADSARRLSGTIPASKSPLTIKGALADPPSFFASQLADALFNGGICDTKTNWQVAPTKAGNYTALDSIASPELSDIVHYTNLNSNNLYAEALLKEIGRMQTGSGSRLNGIYILKKYWKQKGIDTTGLLMDDGCGLSRYDGVTASQLSHILAIISHQTYFDGFLHSLPVAGQSGAMKTMGKGSAIDGLMYCKTGHEDRVRAYCGYIKNKAGHWICFALLVNNYSCTSSEIHDAIEKMLLAIGAAQG